MINEKSQFIKNDAKYSALSMLGIVLLLFITNPSQLPIVFILLFPALISFATLVTARLLLRVFFDISDYHLKIGSYALAGSVLFVLLLGSLKQLGFQDFILVLLLASGLAFYFMRSSHDAQT